MKTNTKRTATPKTPVVPGTTGAESAPRNVRKSSDAQYTYVARKCARYLRMLVNPGLLDRAALLSWATTIHALEVETEAAYLLTHIQAAYHQIPRIKHPGLVASDVDALVKMIGRLPEVGGVSFRTF